MRGFFVTFEGIEGSGKSTQITLLAATLREQGRRVTLTREPGGTAIGDQIRRILLEPENQGLDPTAELLLYAASRAQHLKEVIRPALARGEIVLCDRFSDATLAYQGYGRGLDIDMIRGLDRLVTGGFLPDLTILLDVDSETGLRRARTRNATTGLHAEARFENEALAFHQRVRDGYALLAKREPDRFRVVEALRGPDDIRPDVWAAVEGLLQEER